MSQAGASFVGTVISSTAGSVERTSVKDLRSRHADVHMKFSVSRPPFFLSSCPHVSQEHGGSPQITEQLPSSPPACMEEGPACWF